MDINLIWITSMTSDNLYNCRVCGLKLDDPPWGYDSKTPLYDFCPCCGIEFGYQDATPDGAKQFRKQWVNNGMKWDEESEKPDTWDFEIQLKQVPKQFK